MSELTLEELKAIPVLSEVPDEQLQWFIDNGEIVDLEEGQRVFEVGEPVNMTTVILEGRIRICVMQNGQIPRDSGYPRAGHYGLPAIFPGQENAGLWRMHQKRASF
jgi:hypothetical protein